MVSSVLTCRHYAILREVAAGRAEATRSREPSMKIDGVNCADQAAAAQLFHLGLVTSPVAGRPDEYVPVRLTPDGAALLGVPLPEEQPSEVPSGDVTTSAQAVSILATTAA